MANIQIHHYKVSHTDYLSEQSAPILSLDEQDRANRFINETDRIRYVTVHRFLRLKLAEVLGVDAISIIFRQGNVGKPFIVSPHGSAPLTMTNTEGDSSDIYFNLSYRGDYALLAIADQEVGIDIEKIRPIDDVDAFCSNYFHANERAIIDQSSSDEKAKAIFTFWAFKEAFIKALGIGFSRDLTQFDLSPFYYSPTNELPFEKGKVFTLERVDVAEGYVAAIGTTDLMG